MSAIWQSSNRIFLRRGIAILSANWPNNLNNQNQQDEGSVSQGSHRGECSDDCCSEHFLPLEVAPDKIHRLIHPNGASCEADSLCWECFQDALAYAEAAQREPTYTEAAAKLGMSPLELAARDFFTPPEITRIDLSRYNGRKGDLIEITAFDTVKVCGVGVLIIDEQCKLIEFGQAVHAQGNTWLYKTVKYSQAPSVIVIADAQDLPGHLSEKRSRKKLKRGRYH
mgnify:FL=1